MKHYHSFDRHTTTKHLALVRLKRNPGRSQDETVQRKTLLEIIAGSISPIRPPREAYSSFNVCNAEVIIFSSIADRPSLFVSVLHITVSSLTCSNLHNRSIHTDGRQSRKMENGSCIVVVVADLPGFLIRFSDELLTAQRRRSVHNCLFNLVTINNTKQWRN